MAVDSVVNVLLQKVERRRAHVFFVQQPVTHYSLAYTSPHLRHSRSTQRYDYSNRTPSGTFYKVGRKHRPDWRPSNDGYY